MRAIQETQPVLSLHANRSIYQDIPLYSDEEFLEKAPEDMRTDDTMSDEHQLMLNRLNFELAERQRSVQPFISLNASI